MLNLGLISTLFELVSINRILTLDVSTTILHKSFVQKYLRVNFKWIMHCDNKNELHKTFHTST